MCDQELPRSLISRSRVFGPSTTLKSSTHHWLLQVDRGRGGLWQPWHMESGVKPHRSRNRSDRQREMQGVGSMPENIASQQQSAKHLAARAVMAYRAGFPVALLSVASSSEHSSGIVCDWKGQRDSFHDDAKLLARAFAFIY